MRRPRQPFALPGAGEQRRRAGRPEVEAAAVVSPGCFSRVPFPSTGPPSTTQTKWGDVFPSEMKRAPSAVVLAGGNRLSARFLD